MRTLTLDFGLFLGFGGAVAMHNITPGSRDYSDVNVAG
jgi:hypothetical protein